MSRVYIAAARGERLRAEELAKALRAKGHKVVSGWHAVAMHDGVDEHALAPEAMRAIVAQNVRDVQSADCLVLLASLACRGALVETALAWTWGHRMVAVGRPQAITPMAGFLGGIEWVESPERALEVIGGR